MYFLAVRLVVVCDPPAGWHGYTADLEDGRFVVPSRDGGYTIRVGGMQRRKLNTVRDLALDSRPDEDPVHLFDRGNRHSRTSCL